MLFIVYILFEWVHITLNRTAATERHCTTQHSTQQQYQWSHKII